MYSYIDKELYLGSEVELTEIIVSNILKGNKKVYYAINSDCMLKYWNDIEYKNIIDQEDNLVYVDGMGVIFAQKLLNLPVAQERIATTDLFPNLMGYLESNNINIRVFLLGGKVGTAEKVKFNFNRKYPNVEIVGTHHGYFDKSEESERIIDLINKLNVDLLFVGFGNPIQEKWVNKYQNSIKVNGILTCGGLFDFYSNNVKRAPQIMQDIGLEWLYRLLQEPKRLYKRYIFGNMSYLLKLIKLKFFKF
ncbi:WecB/TagA/CpsF family glycosyltransferase [Bacillus sp. JJ1533]|uniref:WecB/TagA/CpsF family glycosyltransferase n=1 Tax=Bacillus sp. JJ1533 TaxID=3122959 RepID=UPI002FFEDC0C